MIQDLFTIYRVPNPCAAGSISAVVTMFNNVIGLTSFLVNPFLRFYGYIWGCCQPGIPTCLG